MFMHQEDATRHLEIALEVQTQRTIALAQDDYPVKWTCFKTKEIQNTQTYSEPISNLLKGVSNQAEEDNYIGVCLNCFFPVWCLILSPARN